MASYHVLPHQHAPSSSFITKVDMPTVSIGVGVGATLLSAAWSLLLLHPSPSLRRPVRRRALAGALETGQCAAASCRAVGSVVGVVATSQRAVEARVGEGGQGNPLGRRPPFPVNGGGVPVAPVTCQTGTGATGTGALRGRGVTGVGPTGSPCVQGFEI